MYSSKIVAASTLLTSGTITTIRSDDGSTSTTFTIDPSKKGAASGVAAGAIVGSVLGPLGPLGAVAGAVIGGTVGFIFGTAD